MTQNPVLIVGAGPTGLFLALWLTRLGIPIRIIDKNEGPGETSRAMVVHARTLEFYHQLGFAGRVVAQGLKIERIGIRMAGKLKAALRFGDLGEGQSPFPFVLSFPQDEHEKLLIAELEALDVTVERGTELTGFEQDEHGVCATLKTPAGAEVFNASYIAGCDGAHSKVREVSKIGLPGGTYAQRFFVADANVAGDAAKDGMTICLTSGDFCMVIPLRRRGAARLIGVVPNGVSSEHISFADVSPGIIRDTGLEISKVNWFSTYRVHHRVSAKFRDRRAFLLGDAAHLHSPVGGQGMNTGLGDAANLAWKLSAVLRGHARPELLDIYEPERIGFANTLVASTDRLFTLITNHGRAGRFFRAVVLGRIVPLAFKLSSLPKIAFDRISQIEIKYRNSPLAEGRAGAIHAGDRLPWIVTGGADNFEPLGALAWQAHVYGAPTAALRHTAAALGITLNVFAWSSQAKAKGLARDALYLVRPDGYVGMADKDAGPEKLRAYAEKWGIAGG